MHNGIGLAKLGACVHPYPTYAEMFRAMADEYFFRTLKPSEKGFIRGMLGMRS
jgi:hypothetical protein